MTITRLADGTALFSTNYNYLNYDPTGTIVWPVGQTMSASGGNLTWQINGQQLYIRNNTYAAGPKSFNTYIIPMKALNPTITADNFTDYQTANVESPSNAV
jgi:hypothetical protein